MRIYRTLTPCGEPTAVALGYFDGIHLGHRAVIGAAAQCRSQGLAPAVFTFAKTPKRGTESEQLLCFERKVELLEEIGIEILYIIDFESAREKTPEQFVAEVLKGVFNAKRVFCGYNYHFGKNGSATGAELKTLCEKYGITAQFKSPVMIDGEPVSSTKIRAAIKDGDIKTADKMLGRDFAVISRSIEGSHIGSSIGTPTINQRFRSDSVLPKFGVYASEVILDGEKHIGVTNIGVKPTVSDANTPNCETWMPLYGGGELYGKRIEVRLKEFIRPEKRFDSLDELKKAIKADGEKAVNILSEKHRKNRIPNTNA